MGKNDVLFMRWNDLKKTMQDIPAIKELNLISDPQYLMKYIVRGISQNCKILDIGAGDRAMEDLLKKNSFRGIYKSLDIDNSVVHDFRNYSEITGSFDVVCMLEFIEHIELSEAIKYFELSKKVLNDNGYLYISTPNIFHPRYFWTDPTHIQHYPIKFLYGILKLLGFSNIELYRIVELSQKRPGIYRQLKSKVRNRILRAAGFEQATRIFVKCQKH